MLGTTTSSLRLSRLDISYFCLLMLVYFVSASATSCPFPCNPAVQCSHIDLGDCEHGIVKDVCECCDVCGKGPGEFCGGYGKCGEGLVCVQGYEEGLSEQQLRDYPSLCEPAPTTSVAATTDGPTTTSQTTESTTTESLTTTESPISTESPSPSSLNTSNCTDTSTTQTQFASASGSNMLDSCREPCTVSFCSDRARICSAAGLEFKKVTKRNGCQHTSCHACFLLVRPNCDHIRCIEPPNKRCLREYYDCIRDHYLYRQYSSHPVMMRLDDSRASSWAGEIVCHIPEVEDDVWRAG